ncbi:MAG TPA: futalosine hydrolase [Saprospiraceae bacterium]
MSRRITYVSATENEIEPLIRFLKTHAEQQSFQTYMLHGLQIDILISGIGILQTAYSLMDYISHRHPDLWIQVGIGGAFDPSLEIGKVYEVTSEMLTGFGAEDQDGRIMDQFELGWSDPNAFPFVEGKLHCPHSLSHELPPATGMTTFHAHGYMENIEKLYKQPHAQIENMEGAAFFYISLIRKIPFVSVRSISNYVTKRDKASWQMVDAIAALNQTIIKSLEDSEFNPDKLFRPYHR